MAKFKGKNLSLMIGTKEVNLDGTSVVLDNEEADTDAITFAELAAGTPLQWFFTLSAVADYATGTLWDYLWSNAGSSVSFVFKPYGNAVASATQPHFTGTTTINSKPPIGGSANEVFTFEARLDVAGEPVKKTTA